MPLLHRLRLNQDLLQAQDLVPRQRLARRNRANGVARQTSKSFNQSNSYKGKPRMNKRPLTTIATRLLRGALFIVLLFIAVNIISIAHAHPPGSNKPLTNFETSSTAFRSVNSARTTVRIHGTAERSQIASPQQNYSVTSTSRSIGYYLWRGVPCRAWPGGPKHWWRDIESSGFHQPHDG